MATHLLSVLTAVNLALLSYQSLRAHPATDLAMDVPAVIRAHALEIVDGHGRVRASLAVLPEDPKVIWRGVKLIDKDSTERVIEP